MGRGLTTKELEALRHGHDGDRVADRDGVYVRLFESGARSFQLRAVIGGQRPWITLGSYPQVTLAGARARGAKVRELVERGVDLGHVRAALAMASCVAEIEALVPSYSELGAADVAVTAPLKDAGEAATLAAFAGSTSVGAYAHAPSGERAARPAAVPLADLAWEGGVRGRGWVRVSTGEAVPFPVQPVEPGGDVRGGGGDGPSLQAPLAGLTGRSTFHEAAVAWFEWKRHDLSNPKAADQNWNTIRDHVLPHLGARPLADIRRRDIVGVLAPLWRTTHETARRLHGRVREILELAAAQELITVNPAAFDARASLGRQRRRVTHHGSLDPRRATEFWDWLLAAPCDEATRGLAQLLALTAKRTGEGRFLRWGDIHLGNHSWESLAALLEDDPDAPLPWVVWTTSAEHMKMRQEHRVPLARQALQVLVRLRRLAPAEVAPGDLVFARRTRSGTLSENTVLKLVKGFDPGLTGHGLRATFKTWATAAGQDRTLVEFALAHVQDKLDQAYQRSDLVAERRPLMEAWADVLTGGVDVLEAAGSGEAGLTDRLTVGTSGGSREPASCDATDRTGATAAGTLARDGNYRRHGSANAGTDVGTVLEADDPVPIFRSRRSGAQA